MLGWRISFEGGSKGVSPGRVHPMLERCEGAKGLLAILETAQMGSCLEGSCLPQDPGERSC